MSETVIFRHHPTDGFRASIARAIKDAARRTHDSNPDAGQGGHPLPGSTALPTAQDPTKGRGMSQEISRSPHYGDNERRYALGVLALCDGDSRAAAKALKEQGLSGPKDRTLREWATSTHAAEYLAVKKEHAPQVNAAHAERWDQVSKAATSATLKGLKRLDRDMDKIPLRELPRTVRDSSVTGGIAEDKSVRLREGAPDPMTGTRSVKQILEAMEAKGIDPRKLRLTQTVEVEASTDSPTEEAIEGTATETSPHPPSQQVP